MTGNAHGRDALSSRGVRCSARFRADAYAGPMSRWQRAAVGVALLGVLAVWGSGLAVAAEQTAPASSLLAVKVVSCRIQFGAPGSTPSWSPSSLPVNLPARTAARVNFYSDGLVTVLGPKGWACSGLEAADGGASLSVFPTSQADPLSSDHPPATSAGVTVRLDYTGHGPGAEVVCALFPGTQAASLANATGGCPAVPHAEAVQHPTADVATFVDPAGVQGSGEPSGGRNVSSGVVIFPQLHPEPGSVNVAKATCTLPSASASLCGPILGDFVARGLPAQPTS